MVNATPRQLYPRGRDPVPSIQEAGWASGPVWTSAENLVPIGIWSPDCNESSASNKRSKSINQLSDCQVIIKDPTPWSSVKLRRPTCRKASVHEEGFVLLEEPTTQWRFTHKKLYTNCKRTLLVDWLGCCILELQHQLCGFVPCQICGLPSPYCVRHRSCDAKQTDHALKRLYTQ